MRNRIIIIITMSQYFLLLVFAIPTLQKLEGYPNCVSSYQSKSESQTFNTKFLKLTQFLLPKSSQIMTPSLNQLFSPSIPSTLNYTILIGTFILLSFIFLIVRTKLSYSIKMRTFLNKNSGSVLGPCIVILAIIVIVFFGLCVVQFRNVFQKLDGVDCIGRYSREIIVNGRNESGWSGIAGFVKVLQIQVKYLQKVKQMSVAALSPSIALTPRLKTIHAQITQFQNLYEFSTLTYTDPYTSTAQQIMFSGLLPELLPTSATSTPIWLKSLNTTNLNLYNIGNLAIQIEQYLKQASQSSNNTINGLNSKIKYYKMLNNQILKLNVMKGGWMSSGLGVEMEVMVRVGLAVGIQAGFCYLVLVLIVARVKNRLALKIGNFLWVILILQLLLCLIITYFVSGIGVTLYNTCPKYQQFLYNKTYYDQISTSSPSQKNLLEHFSPCFFPSASSSSSSSPSYLSLPSNQFSSIVPLLSSIYSFISLTRPASLQYINLNGYEQAYDSVIKQVMKEVNSINGRQSWQLLKAKMQELNNYTLYDGFDEKCYKHRWVYEYSQCLSSQTRVLNKNTNLLLPEPLPQQLTTSCLPFLTQSGSGTTVILSFNDYLTNYMKDTNQPRCSQSLSKIIPIGLAIITMLQLKQDNLKVLTDSLEEHRAVLEECLRLVRTLQIQVQEYYLNIVGLGSGVVTTQAVRDFEFAIQEHGNCTAVTSQLFQLYQDVCISTYSSIMTIFLMMILTCITLSMLVVVGLLYGLNEEIKQIQALIEEESDQEQSNVNLAIDKTKRNSTLEDKKNGSKETIQTKAKPKNKKQ